MATASFFCPIFPMVILCFIFTDHTCLSCSSAFMKRHFSRDTCDIFPLSDDECKQLYLGKRQAEDITLGLYRSISKDTEVDQENFLLVPLELSRLISSLIHATTMDTSVEQNDTEILHQIRCYVDKTTETLQKTLLVPTEADTKGHDKDKGHVNPGSSSNSDEDGTTGGNSGSRGQNKTTVPKMMQIGRMLFVDEKLKASDNFSMQARCWYGMKFEKVDFMDKEKPVKEINKWAVEENDEALENVSNLKKKDPARRIRKPLAGDPSVVAQDRVVLASSVFLKVIWKDNLFNVHNTKPSEPFFIKLRGEHPHKNAETNVKIPMMATVNKFNFLNADFYTAVSLPLVEGLKAGHAIFVLPKPESNLTVIEDELLGSGLNLQSFLENMQAAKEKMIKVMLPRLTIQVTHEWATPGSKRLGQITNNSGIALDGKAVGVYQDVFLELVEGTTERNSHGKSFSSKEERKLTEDKAEHEKNASEIEFTLDRPFFFFITVDSDILALGRIKDPFWCKFCHNRYGGGNKTAVADPSHPETNDSAENTKSLGMFARLRKFWDKIVG